jgi:hypothetical protein
VVVVPIARDGSKFTPTLKRKTGFWIGEKGAERTVETFEEALSEFRRMQVPRWRRPNEAGNWGIVAGVGWVDLEIDTSPIEE